MTFSEYYNGLYPFLSDGDTNREVFFDDMIRHFIYEEVQESCELLLCKRDTKMRYIKDKNPNKIKSEYAQFAYSKHNRERYIEWFYNRMREQDSFQRVEEWLAKNNVKYEDISEACDELLENILLDIGFPNATDEDKIDLPESSSKEQNTDVLGFIEKDRKLLEAFCIDYDGILETCISKDMTEVWCTGRLLSKIENLNDKWKKLASEFSDVRIQADILRTLAALKDFNDALDPDKRSAPGTSIRRLRLELRNCYIKIHPTKYADIFPYEAFIDDWEYE